jgi:hypothetical protein
MAQTTTTSPYTFMITEKTKLFCPSRELSFTSELPLSPIIQLLIPPGYLLHVQWLESVRWTFKSILYCSSCDLTQKLIL